MYAAIKAALVAIGHQKKDNPWDEELVAQAVEETTAEVEGAIAQDQVPANDWWRLIAAGAASKIAGVDVSNYAARLAAWQPSIPAPEPEPPPKKNRAKKTAPDPTDIVLEDVE